MFRIVSFCLVLFLSCFFRIGAQNIKVESFTRLETDITARVNVVKDANDDECALIKMVTTDVDYNMDESLKREIRVGEILFYVPQGTKRIVIRHQKLGKLVYPLPETLKAKTTYQIKLPSNVEIIVHEDAGGQYVVMNVQPSDASVYIDNILEATNGGNFSRMLKYGDHTYRVEHPLYETKSGTFAVKNKKELIEIKLVPAYGYLSFTSTPANAEITVNGKVLGHTPFKSEALREGTYRVKTSLSSYSEDEREVTVVRGQMKEVAIPLAATFGYMEVNTVPEQGADVYINGMKVGKTPYRSDKLSEGVYKVKVEQLMYASQEREVRIVRGEIQQVRLDLAATFAEVIISTECPQAEIYVNDERKGVGIWKGRLTEGVYQLKSHIDSHRDGIKNVEIKSGLNQEITIPVPTAVYGTLNVNSNPTGGVIKIDGKEVGHTPDVISKVLIGERKIEIVKEGCATFNQIVVIEEGKVQKLDVPLSQGKEVYIEAFEPINVEIDGISYGKTPLGRLLSYGKHNLVAKDFSNGLDIQEEFVVTEHSSDELLIRNKAFPALIKANREVVINGIKYFFNYNASGDVIEIFAYDNYTHLQKKLPVPRYCFFNKYSIYGDIQGCFVLGENVWINGKWKELKELSTYRPSVTKNMCVASYKDHGYLYIVKEYQDHFEVVRRDIVKDQDQSLFSYATKLKPYGELKFVDETHLQYTGSLWTKDKKGGIKNAKDSFDFYIRTDSVPLPPLMCGSYLMDKKDYIAYNVKAKIGSQTNRVQSFSASAIDWSGFPEKYYSDAKDWTYIIGNAAYVLVIRSTSTDFRENFKKWEPSLGYMKNYVAKGSKITLSMNALYKYDFQLKTWSKCPHKFIPGKTGKVYTSNPSPGSSSIPSFSASVSGKYLVIDSQYRFDTEANSWK